MRSFRAVKGRRRTPVVVGRRAELDTLDEALADVGSGAGRILVVSGDAGIGKSRLIEEFASRHDDALVVIGHCVDASTDALAYAPWSELFWWLTRAVDADVLGSERAELSRLLPEIDLTDGDASDGGKRVLFEAVVEVLHRAALHRLLVVVVEDIHWIDAASRDLLLAVVRNRRRLPLLLVVTHRPESSSVLDDLTGQLAREGAIAVPLGALGDDEAADVASQLTGREPDDTEVRSVVARADGNPLFVEELAAALGDDRLPETLRHLLLIRFTTLTPDAQHLVQTASVIGLRVPRAWLADAGGLSKEATRAAARDAVAAGIFVAADDRRGYVFAHSLLRDAVLNELLPDELIELHEAVAGALEAHPVTADDIDTTAELARHWDAAEHPANALRWTVAAAEQAKRRYAFATALALYRRALAWWVAVEDAASVAGRNHTQLLFDAADAAGEAAALAEAADYASHAAAEAGPAAAIEVFPRAHAHLWGARRVAELHDLSAIALSQMNEVDAATRLFFLVDYSTFLLFAGRPEDVVALEPVMTDALGEITDAVLHVRTRLVFAWCFEALGDGERADGEFREAIVIARRSDLNTLLALVTYNYASFFTSCSRFGDCLEQLDLAQALIDQHGLLRLQVAVPALRAGVLAWCGDLAGATAELDRVRDVATVGVDRHAYLANRSLVEIYSGSDPVSPLKLGNAWDDGFDSQRVLQRAFVLAEAQIQAGDLDAAAATVEDALAEMRGRLDAFWVGFVAATGVRIEADRVAAAQRTSELHLAACERAEAIVAAWRDNTRRLHTWFPLVEAHDAAINAELARLTGEAGATAAHDAAEHFAAIQMPYYETYWQWREAEALIRARSRESPVAILSAARKRAIRHGFTWLERAIDRIARAEQLRLGSRADQPDELLSRREVEVLRLLSEGRSNPEIADALVIGRRTVRTHVSNIMQKLGASSRGEAVAVAHEREIL
jgi:DNA-binding NarL/FixJ family response regulator